MTPDLKTTYLGLEIRNPLVVAACPLTREVHQIERLEQAGAGAAVMYSLFAEQVEDDSFRNIATGASGAAEVVEAGPLHREFAAGLDSYLRNIELAKKAVAMPLIGSLNGCGPGEWTRFAPLVEQSGADALELNVYFVPTDPKMTGLEVEARYLDIVADVRQQIKIPLAVKIGPFFSSIPNFATRLVEAGADGLVLFNRFLQPDVDIETFAVEPRLVLSTPDELRLPLRWIAILREQLAISLAATTGVHSAADVIKLLLVGTDAVMVASVLLKQGPDVIEQMIAELVEYLTTKDFPSISALRATVCHGHCSDPAAFERANYIKSLVSFEP